ncbi:MAG TPA: hypothetical protein VKA83_28140 [Methylomirabilota bacterium]|jgi:hypothetical protein|nr:hypothetical protein [Methylomirabilota bacterium]
MTHVVRTAVLLLLLGLSPALAWGLSIGQQDTFQDGTTNGWGVSLLDMSSPTPPVNVPGGGPGGATDSFLKITSVTGVGPGNLLSAINIRQWSGDYIAAGISGIRMDLNNVGSTGLSLRVLLSDATGAAAANAAFSTIPVLLPAGSGWVTELFSIAPGDLTPGVGSVTAALHNTVQLQLYHAVGATSAADSVTGTLGVDNITATPGPSSALLLGSGLLALYSLTTWRGRKPRA